MLIDAVDVVVVGDGYTAEPPTGETIKLRRWHLVREANQ